MIDRLKVINGLECHVNGHPHTRCHKCPYWGTGPHGSSECSVLAADALVLLKAQEPCLMTLDDAINSEMVWVECSNGDGGYGTCRFVEIYGMIAAEVFMLKNKYPERNRLNPEKYLREWRCWTSCPTDKQREATPWA